MVEANDVSLESALSASVEIFEILDLPQDDYEGQPYWPARALLLDACEIVEACGAFCFDERVRLVEGEDDVEFLVLQLV